MTRKIKRYGWIPDLPDQRDFMYAAPLTVLRALPPKKDLTSECLPVYDQGELGSCTANAIGAAHQFEQLMQNTKKALMPYAYLTDPDLAADFWTIRMVEVPTDMRA
jgi:hypothetical protein